MFAMLLACVAGELPPPPTAAATETTEASETETGVTDTGSSTEDSAPPVDTAPIVLSCPVGMSGVSDEEGELLYCIDSWEVEVDDMALIGSADQYGPAAESSMTGASSLAGVEPSVGVSFGQAQAVCAITPVLNSVGRVMGYKHLATLAEWQDAGDGVVGEGGTTYPYGDTFDEDACACASADDEILYEDVQLTGSFPDCVSDFGVYDQTGNIWEWADPEQAFDLKTWWSSAESFGLYEDGGHLATTEDRIDADAELLIAGVEDELTIGEDGRLMVAIGIKSWDYRQSYPIGQLRLRGQGRYSLLPVELIPLEPDADTTECYLRIMTERDGHPIVEKVGGAHYLSTDSCVMHDPNSDIVHHHSFDGSIGFRCASPPIALE